MPKPFVLAIAFIGCALAQGCFVEDSNDFDFEGKHFYYGCTATRQCADPSGESEAYVCCLDLLDTDAGLCEGRCLPASKCATGSRTDDDPNPCAALTSDAGR